MAELLFAIAIVLILIIILRPKFIKLERLEDIGKCSYVCDHHPGGMACAACLNSMPQDSDPDLRAATIGLLE